MVKSFRTFIHETVNKEGYHKNLVLYHGTSHHFDSFSDKKVKHKQTPDREIQGHHFTTDDKSAASYARRSARETGGKPRVIKAHLHMENPYNATNDIKKHQKKGMTFSDAKNHVYKNVDREKHDGVYHNGSGINHSEYVAFHPHQIKPIHDK